MRWTKTIQRGERILQIPLVMMPDGILCPVRADRTMCKAITASADAPLFITPQNHLVNYSMYQSKLRYYIQK